MAVLNRTSDALITETSSDHPANKEMSFPCGGEARAAKGSRGAVDIGAGLRRKPRSVGAFPPPRHAYALDPYSPRAVGCMDSSWRMELPKLNPPTPAGIPILHMNERPPMTPCAWVGRKPEKWMETAPSLPHCPLPRCLDQIHESWLA